MQMKFRSVPVLTLALMISFTSCKKDDAPNNKPDNELSTHSEDQNAASNEMDAVTNETNALLESSTNFAGKMQNPPVTICGANYVVDTVSNPRTITIYYNGNNCANTHLRSGTVVISMPAGVRWKDAGAQLTISYENLAIKNLTTNKWIIINGAYTYTNTTGGLLINLPTQQTITHRLAATNINLMFGDSSQAGWHLDTAIWNVSRSRTFTYNNGIVATINGTHTIGNNQHVAEWGTNRFGHPFVTSISQPLVFRQDCNGRLTAGEITHSGFATATATFGLDAGGNPTSCPGTGHYYYRLAWTGPNGGSGSVILPY